MPEFGMIQDGFEREGNGLKVGNKGEMFAGGVQSAPVTIYLPAVGASMVLVPARERRSQALVQNLDPVNPLNIKLGTGPVTAADLMIPAGGSFTFPPGVTYEGEIDGAGLVAAVPVVIVEFT